MPSVPTPPAVPPAAPVPAPPAAAPLPAVKKPKLSRIQRNAINNAIEQVQEWVSENEVAVRAQAHAGVDWALGKINGVLKQAHPTVDDVIGWAKGKLATLKV